MKKKIIIFDLDDTLILEISSAEESFIEASKHAQTIHGILPSKLHESVRHQARKIWYSLPTYPYCQNIGISSWEGLWAKFNGENQNVKELNKISEQYKTNSWHNALLTFGIDNVTLAKELSHRFQIERRKRHILFPEVIEVLKIISNKFRLGMITNGIPDLQYEKIRGGGIERFFENIIISGEYGIGKPKKEIFSIAINKFNAKKDDCIMVGNSLKSDILGAKNIGIKSVWINRFNKKKKSPIEPDYTIKSLFELINILEIK